MKRFLLAVLFSATCCGFSTAREFSAPFNEFIGDATFRTSIAGERFRDLTNAVIFDVIDGKVDFTGALSADGIVHATGGLSVSGDFGIGTRSPSVNMHVLDSSADSNVLVRLENDAQAWQIGNSGGTGDRLILRDVTNANDVLRIQPGAPASSFEVDSNGAVGFGKVPGYQLHLYRNSSSGVGLGVQNEGTGAAFVRIENEGGSGDPRIQFAVAGTGTWSLGSDNDDSESLKISYNDDSFSSPAMSVKTGGEVEIPAGSLVNTRSGLEARLNGGTVNPSLELRGGTIPFVDFAEGGSVDDYDARVGLWDSDTLRLYADNGAYSTNGLQIGANADTNKIDDSSNGSGSTTMYIGNAAISTAFTGFHYHKLSGQLLGEAQRRGRWNLSGALVRLNGQGELVYTNQANDPRALGLLHPVTDWKTSMGEALVVSATKEVSAGEKQTRNRVEVPKADAIEMVDVARRKYETVNGATVPVVAGTRNLHRVNDDGSVSSRAVMQYATETVTRPRLRDGYHFHAPSGVFWKWETEELTEVVETGEPLAADDLKPAELKDYAFAVASVGDSYEEHITSDGEDRSLRGAWVVVRPGETLAPGDLLSSAAKPGFLAKQSNSGFPDSVVTNYTVGKYLGPPVDNSGGSEAIEFKDAYIVFVR